MSGATLVETAFLEMIAVCGTAAGLVLLGAARALLAGRAIALRAAAAAGCTLVPALGLTLLGYPALAAVPAGVVGAVGFGLNFAGSGPAAWVVARLRLLARPGVQAAALSAGGGALLVGALARYEMVEQAADEADVSFMTQATWRPPLREAAGPPARTDAGRPVPLWQPISTSTVGNVAGAERGTLDSTRLAERAIRTGPADETFNCHGWVFAGGQYWLGPDAVETILADNGYQAVSDPRPGDVVIYRSSETITHTAVVCTVAGGLVLLESKWGWMGTFVHTPESSPYGREYTYYRSPRDGHLLAGLGGQAASPAHENADPGPGVGH